MKMVLKVKNIIFISMMERKLSKKASYFFEREGHFEDEDGNKVTTNLEKSGKNST